MNVDTIYASSVFISGILSFFSPCIIPLLPVYFSLFMGKESVRKVMIIKAILFVLGISTTFIILGFGAGFLSSFINNKSFYIFLGCIVIGLGIHQMGFIKWKWLNIEKKIQYQFTGNYFSAFLLGLSFSFGWTPCIGPILGAVLGLSAHSGYALQGEYLMFIYALGFMIPFLVLTFFSGILLEKIRWINQYGDKLKRIGGIIIILMGVLLMSDNLNWLITLGG